MRNAQLEQTTASELERLDGMQKCSENNHLKEGYGQDGTKLFLEVHNEDEEGMGMSCSPVVQWKFSSPSGQEKWWRILIPGNERGAGDGMSGQRGG